MYRRTPLYIMLIAAMAIGSCSHRFHFEDVCFNFKLCTLDDAIRYEEFIGSELIEDSVFYSYTPSVVFKRRDSGCGLPLNVSYSTWHSESKHLYDIEYFWGPYQGLAYDSLYVQREMRDYFSKHPHPLKRLKKVYLSLANQFSAEIGYTPGKEATDAMASGFIGWWGHDGVWDAGVAYDRIIEVQRGPVFSEAASDECLYDKEKYSTHRDVNLKRCNEGYSMARGSWPDYWTVILDDSDRIQYSYMILELKPGARSPLFDNNK